MYFMRLISQQLYYGICRALTLINIMKQSIRPETNNTPMKISSSSHAAIQADASNQQDLKQIQSKKSTNKQVSLLNSSSQPVLSQPKVEKQDENTGEEQPQEKKKRGKNKFVSLKSNEEIQMEINRWKMLKKEMQDKKSREALLIHSKNEQLNKAIQERKQRMQKQAEEKREQIRRRIEQIEKRKVQRESESKNKKKSQNYSKDPLYAMKEKQFILHKMEEQNKIKANILKKKSEMLLDFQELKEHERNYLNRIKERRQNRNSESSSQSHQRHKSEFNLWSAHNLDQKKKDQQKYLRRKQFEEKVKQIPVLIDHYKMKEALVARDKAKNPMKYNYLSEVAALSDEKIYDEFKQFSININGKELGNQYMKKVHYQNQNQQSRLTRGSGSSSHLEIKSERVEYKNYLPQIKSILKKRVEASTPTSQIEQVLHRYQRKSDRLAEFSRKSDTYEIEAIKKIKELKDVAGYSECLNKEEIIDDLYMKSLKLKIASASVL